MALYQEARLTWSLKRQEIENKTSSVSFWVNYCQLKLRCYSYTVYFANRIFWGAKLTIMAEFLCTPRTWYTSSVNGQPRNALTVVLDIGPFLTTEHHIYPFDFILRCKGSGSNNIVTRLYHIILVLVWKLVLLSVWQPQPHRGSNSSYAFSVKVTRVSFPRKQALRLTNNRTCICKKKLLFLSLRHSLIPQLILNTVGIKITWHAFVAASFVWLISKLINCDLARKGHDLLCGVIGLFLFVSLIQRCME